MNNKPTTKALQLITCLMTFIATMSVAQRLPQHVELAELGLSFDIPAGWVGQLTDDAIILGHNQLSGLMVLTENSSSDPVSLKQQALQGIQDDNIQLRAQGEFIIKHNNRVEGMYTGHFNGAAVSSYGIGLINGLGHGMNILVITEQTQFTEQHKQAANELAASVKFYQAKDSNITQQWKQHLVGNQLKYMKTQGGSDYGGGYSGTSSVRQIDLCSNGQFAYYSNNHSSFSTGSSTPGGFGYANAQGDGTGSYTIRSLGEESVLILSFNNGDEREYQLSYTAEQHTLLNGQRYFVVDSEQCN